MKKVFLSVLLLLLMLACRQQPDVVQHDGLAYAPMESERLPDLSEPRTYHALVWAGDHILALGGHTTGFVPSATAEYFFGRTMAFHSYALHPRLALRPDAEERRRDGGRRLRKAFRRWPDLGC